jgi:hypothetical protein
MGHTLNLDLAKKIALLFELLSFGVAIANQAVMYDRGQHLGVKKWPTNARTP